MKRLSNKTDQCLYAFFEATGIGALCFDAQLNIVSCQPSKRISDDFICLGMQRITAFLSEKYSADSVQKGAFYTFFLESNLVCNIALLYRDGRCDGALVTQPVLIKRLGPDETERLLSRLNPHSAAREVLRADLFKIPVISYDKIIATGGILSSLSETFFSEGKIRQILCGGEESAAGTDPVQGLPAFKSRAEEDAAQRHSSFSTYLRLKEGIQKGDTELLLEVMEGLDAGSVPMDQRDRQDFVRSLKNTFIMVCAMASYMAIDANARFYKMMDFADGQIRRMEGLKNINDIYELMKNTLLAFAREVSVARLTSYSKPVRQAMDYIERHYAEKITLDELAKHAKLSPPYLSNLIRKETGRNLADNINRVRIEQSKRLLMNTNMDISAVARGVGFRYQNHFASIFKKFTGNSPTEFQNPAGLPAAKDDSRGPLSLLAGPVKEMLLRFPGLCDTARIVDPAGHRFWMIHHGSESENMLEGTCYDFWKRGSVCENCVSARAYVSNSLQYKIDRQGQKFFLVLAIPRMAGKNIYVVELLKNVTEGIAANMDLRLFQPVPAAGQGNSALDIPDESSGLHSRAYIDRMLPREIRGSRMSGEPLSLLLLAFGFPDSFAPDADGGGMEEPLQSCADRISVLVGKSGGWAGHYTGNIFLIVLKRTDDTAARRIGVKIKADLENSLLMWSGPNGGIHPKVAYSVKTLTDQVADADLLQSAWTDLCAEGLACRLSG